MLKKASALAIGVASAVGAGVAAKRYYDKAKKMEEIKLKEEKHKLEKERIIKQAQAEKAMLRRKTVDPSSHIDILTEIEANKRKKLISDINYTIGLALTEDDYFEGQVHVTFNIHEKSENLFIDFKGECIYYAKFNQNTLLLKDTYKNSRILLPLEFQNISQPNVLEVFYRCKYSKSGEGLQIYYDQTDRNSYVYSQFAPFAAHKCFPCFDQPNLKATFLLFIICPNGWKAISSTIDELMQDGYDSSTEVLLEKHSIHKFLLDCYVREPTFYMFKKSVLISPHLFAVISGPFTFFGNQRDNLPPFRVYARLTLSKYVERYSNEIFNFLGYAIQYFSKYLGTPYMFNKLDIIFCPDYLYTAMENVGAITFSEKLFMFYNKSTFEETSEFLFMILFEVAHMWIGDTVTHNWWNDLWLNEGIARFLAVQAIEDDAKLSYYMGWSLQTLNNQRNAFKADESPSTHSIEGTCIDSCDIAELLDSLTFTKSSSVIFQLMTIIGKSNFQKCLQQIMKLYRNSNASSNDLMKLLKGVCAEDEKLKQFNIDDWMNEWVKTSGVSILIPIWKEKDGIITQFAVKQEPSNSTIFRNHNIKISLFYFSEKEQEIIEDVAITKDSITELNVLVGRKAPDAVLLNSTQCSYAISYLDEKSYHSFMANIEKINKRLLNTIILYSLYKMSVLLYNPFEFFNFICDKCESFKCSESSVPEAIRYLTKLCYYIFPDNCFLEYSKKAIDTIIKLFTSNVGDYKTLYHVRTVALQSMIKLESTEEDILRIDALIRKYSTDEHKNDFDVPLKLKYKHYTKLCSLPGLVVEGMKAVDYVKGIIENGDENDELIKLKESHRAALPNFEVKLDLLNRYLNPVNDEPYEMLEASMKSYRQRSQVELMKNIDAQIFKMYSEIEKMDRRKACMFLKYVFPKGFENQELWHLSNLEKTAKDKIVLNQIKVILHRMKTIEIAKERSIKMIPKSDK